MSVHFISVLGTGLYEPVIYSFETDSDHTKERKPQDFVQLSLLDHFYNQLQKDGVKISFLLTEKARKDNWDDRDYIATGSNPETQRMARWPEKIRPTGKHKKGLYSELNEQFPALKEKIEPVDILGGRTDQEMWDIFQRMYDCIRENDEIIFDITHSFRSIPMLAIAVINYAKVMKHCTLAGIYYGAYEAGERDVDGILTAPIYDLTIYDEIMAWTHAADSVDRYGDPGEMLSLIRARMASPLLDVEEKKQWGPVSSHLKAMKELSNCLNTCRGVSAETVSSQRKKQQESIQTAFQYVKGSRLDESARKTSKTLAPLQPLLDKAEAAYAMFDCQENYETGMQAVSWYLAHEQIQQGFTALEETAKTFLCAYYQLPESDRDVRKIVNRIVTEIGRAQHEEEVTQTYRADVISRMMAASTPGIENLYGETQEGTNHASQIPGEDSPLSRGSLPEEIKDKEVDEDTAQVVEQYKDTWIKMITELPYDYASTVCSVKHVRNDINHFGMRMNPTPAQNLKNQLQGMYEDLKKQMQQMARR